MRRRTVFAVARRMSASFTAKNKKLQNYNLLQNANFLFKFNTCRDPYRPNDNELEKLPNERNMRAQESKLNAYIEHKYGTIDKLIVATRRQ